MLTPLMVNDQMRSEVWSPARGQCSGRLFLLVGTKAWDRVWDQIRDEVRDQILWELLLLDAN